MILEKTRNFHYETLRAHTLATAYIMTDSIIQPWAVYSLMGEGLDMATEMHTFALMISCHSWGIWTQTSLTMASAR